MREAGIPSHEWVTVGELQPQPRSQTPNKKRNHRMTGERTFSALLRRTSAEPGADPGVSEQRSSLAIRLLAVAEASPVAVRSRHSSSRRRRRRWRAPRHTTVERERESTSEKRGEWGMRNEKGDLTRNRGARHGKRDTIPPPLPASRSTLWALRSAPRATPLDASRALHLFFETR